MNRRSLLDEISRVSEQPEPLPPQKPVFSSWVIDALLTSLDAKPLPVDPHRIDSSICEKCRRDISLETGTLCPHCQHPRPQRSNLTLSAFEPLCPDCGYNLSGLQDGRCPECNRAFYFEVLRQSWAIRRGSATRRYSTSFGIFLIGMLAAFFTSVFANDYVTFCIAIGLSLLFPVIHYRACPTLQVDGGHTLLLAIVPIAIAGIAISLNDFAAPGQIATLLAATLLAIFSLRAAPFKSALVLATAVSIPLLAVGLVYLVQGLIAFSEGEPFTSNELPQQGKFRMAPTNLSLMVGGGFCAVSILMTALASIFSRRIILQIRAAKNPHRTASSRPSD